MGPLVRKLDHWWQGLEVDIGLWPFLSLLWLASLHEVSILLCQILVATIFCLPAGSEATEPAAYRLKPLESCMSQDKDFLSNYLRCLVVVVRRLTAISSSPSRKNWKLKVSHITVHD